MITKLIKESISSKFMSIPKLDLKKHKRRNISQLFNPTNNYFSNYTSKKKLNKKEKSYINNNNLNIFAKITPYKYLKDSPNITTTKIENLNSKRKKRIENEKKNRERDKKIYNEILEEFKSNKKNNSFLHLNSIKNNNNNSKLEIRRFITTQTMNNNSKIKISQQQTISILEKGGMLDAYKYLLIQLCKNGLPTGNVFIYSANVIKNYEKKWKIKNAKKLRERADQIIKMKEEENKIHSFMYRSMKIGENYKNNNFFYRSQSFNKNKFNKNNIETNFSINWDENVRKTEGNLINTKIIKFNYKNQERRFGKTPFPPPKKLSFRKK